MQNPVHNLFGFLFALIAVLLVALVQTMTPALPADLSDESEPEIVRDDRPMRSCLNCED